MTAPRAAVFDCNVFLQAMLSTHGPAYACWQMVVGGEITLYVSPFILGEIRNLPTHRKLLRFSQLTPERVERFIEQLLDVTQLVTHAPSVFRYPRDPDDTPYVDLAIAAHALLIVSNDKDLH